MCLVPNIWPTKPFVGGTVDSHRSPKVTPNTTELNILGGKYKKYIRDTPLNKYIAPVSYTHLTLPTTRGV